LPGQIEEALTLAVAAHHETRQNAVHQSPQEVLVATAYFAGDYCRAQHVLGVVVGGGHGRIMQEHQPFAAMFPHMLVEAIQVGAESAFALVDFEPRVQTVFEIGSVWL
jgi:hypothetical protein